MFLYGVEMYTDVRRPLGDKMESANMKKDRIRDIHIGGNDCFLLLNPVISKIFEDFDSR